MSRFGPDPRAFFDSVYREVAPWDVGEAQPALAALLDEIPPEGPVLDVGCGTGDLALALARGGLAVVGIDFAEGAIAEARERARSLPPEVAARLELRVGDAFRLRELGRRFGAVVDSGFLHTLDAAQRDLVLREVAEVLLPGGRYYLLAFAVEFPLPNTPMRVTEEEVRTRFAAAEGWTVRLARPAAFESRIAPVPAIAACAERLPT